ncbi:MAG TPA: hypothetical protein VNW29_01450 [Candidatus Sulfotelmatobacter sp.]|jgi:hypothetical protein|nr:hypothetical protein [Candidatus Sulfotelmatobacter sp.]
MQNEQQNQEKIGEIEKNRQTSDTEAHEAFKEFMNAHFGNPVCQKCISHYFR